MKKKTIKILSILYLSIVTFTNTFSQTRNSDIQNATEYFHQRKEAISLAQKAKWQEAIPLLESLTAYYQKDSDLFYVLGLAYYQTEQYQNAIVALKQTLDLGGTILTGIPTGSRPSNDIMIKIAKAYALDGDKTNSMSWLQKGFAARYDEKMQLQGNSAFKSFSKDKDYLALFGIDSQKNMTRDDAWKKDIDYLLSRIEQLHFDMNHYVSKVDYEKVVHDLKTSISHATDEQIIVKMMKVLGTLGTGHNLLIPTSSKIGALKKLPVQFYQFDDGLFIVDADKDYEKWIGYKVELFENTSAELALQKTNAVNARDNDMQILWLGPYYLGLPDVLEGLGIIEDANQVSLTLSNSKGKSEKATMNPVAWNFTGTPVLPKLKAKKQPLFLSKKEDFYWSKVLPEHNAMYVQFNAFVAKDEPTFPDFNLKLLENIKQNNYQNLILDMRLNAGGNGAMIAPMLKALIKFESTNPKGKIFVLIGRGTFSAAQNFLVNITKNTNAIIVGEPSGSSPNFAGEAGYFKLPYSGLWGIIASQYHQSSTAEDKRKWVAPHIPVGQSSTDFFNGNDKALNSIFEIIKSDKN